MKFLICGFGNIGQRHFRNLKTLLPDCVIDMYCSEHPEGYRIFDNYLNNTHSKNIRDFYDINNIYHVLEFALVDKYDAVFICSLPPERIDIAIKAAKLGNNLFIEKPLSNDTENIYKLQEIVEDKGLECAIGYQMRFHPAIKHIKKNIENYEYGRIYRVEINHCNSIDNWTKGRDLYNFYALDNKSGGGVILSQIHEIDYSFWLFGKHYPISAIYGNLLGYDVEDYISIMSNIEDERYCFPVNINLDFLSKEPKRDIAIYGTEKTESFDLLDTFPLSWNDLFLEEMRAFIGSLYSQWQQPLAKLEDGISSLEFCMDVKNNFTDIKGM